MKSDKQTQIVFHQKCIHKYIAELKTAQKKFDNPIAKQNLQKAIDKQFDKLNELQKKYEDNLYATK